MRIGECVDLSVDCVRSRPQPVGHPCTAGRAQNERCVPVDSMVCQLIERIRFLRPNHVDSQTPRCPAGCRGCRRHYRPHRPTPISTHLWNGDAAGALVTKPAHDFGVPRNRPTGSPARVPLGSLSSQTLGAISDQLLWFPTPSRFVELDRIINGRPARSGNVPPQRRLQPPTS
jgi:hypothetical protein